MSIKNSALPERLLAGLLPVVIVLMTVPAAWAGWTAGFNEELLTIQQPLDHAKPDGPELDQKVEVLIPQTDAPAEAAQRRPVFFVLGGHPDPSLLDLPGLWQAYGSPANVIFVRAAHRGYDEAISRQADQTRPEYVDVEQALQDFREVRVRLGRRFKGPWLVVGYGYGGAMAIEFASRWPELTAAVLSSSGLLISPLTTDAFDRSIDRTLGREVYLRLARHMRHLKPKKMFDENWRDREFLIAVLHGLIQYPNLRENLALFKESTRLPTFMFISILRGLDRSVGRSQARAFALSDSKKKLDRAEALSGDFNWRYWRWQQCSGLAGFEVGSRGEESVFTRTLADHCAECKALFNTSPCQNRNWDYKPTELIKSMKTPLVYVSGGQDPWAELGLPPDKTQGVIRLHFPEGCHCPDRSEAAIGRKVLAALMKAAGLKDSPPAR